MYAVILAAGAGKRMDTITNGSQKTMVSLSGKPKLEYTLDSLPDKIRDVVMVVGHKKEEIVSYFGSSYRQIRIQYIVQEELKGTAHAVSLCKDVLKDQDSFLVLNGDDLYEKNDLTRLLRYRYSLLAHYSYDAKKFGLITIDENDNFESIVEKSAIHPEGLINAGAYTLGNEFFTQDLVYFSEREAGLPHTLLAMHKDHPARVVHASDWQPVGTPEEYEELLK